MTLRVTIASFLVTFGIVLGMAPSHCFAQANSGVTVKEDELTYTLDNGIVSARVAKASGDLVSLRYKDMEMLATRMGEDGQPDLKLDPPGHNVNGLNRGMTDHQYGFWSHDAMGQRDTQPAVPSITIDPKSNGGARGEVAVKGIANGRLMGTGPGANGGNFISDIEIRWALGRGDSGVYTYCMFEHKVEYAATTITEARFCAKLAEFFDWMSVADDEHHNKHYPKELREGDKYVYTTNQSKNRAFGWSSSTKNVGFFEINPSMEYMSGGPTKIEFLGHRDTNPVAAPCVLNYWRSSHYGGAEVSVAAGEHWAKVIGPFMLYVNSGGDSQALFKDAKEQAAKEAQKWPFDWVKGVDYPSNSERATVKGQLVLTDSQKPSAKLPNLLVGLTAPAWTMSGFGGAGRTIDWQQDAKHYEFWVRGGEDGQFTIPAVRAGNYTMHAFADGVLGEFAKADIKVETGKPLDLGKITWTPVRRGKELWAIGIPNRYGSEFFKGDIYYTPGIAQTYAELFPNDITYTIGKSDYTKDWYFLHVPHYDVNAPPPPARGGFARGNAPATGPAGIARGNAPTTAPTGAGSGNNSVLARGAPPTTGPAGARGRGAPAGFGAPPANGRAAPRTIVFDLPAAAHGKATLRIAFSATSARTIEVAVNDKSAGQFDRLPGDGAISSHGMHGIWHEKEFSFDASLLKQGQNTLKLTVPADAVNNGVIYDYLRLELDESAVPTASAAQ